MAVEMEIPSAALDEGAAGDTESDEEEELGSGSESSSSDSGAESGAKTTSKKKKKKKKKKSGGGGGGGGGAQPPVDPAARKEGERRYQEAVDQLSHNSEDSMWVKLGGCHLADGKLKKLCEALRGNTTVISLDLSGNQLTDEGAKVLAAALRDGRAPDLIDLDLTDNPQIGPESEGAAALRELQHERKTLKVAVGPSQPPAPPPKQQQPRSPKHGQQQGGGGQPPPPQQQQQQQQQQQGANGTLADTIKSNPVLNKYFAVGNEEAEEEEQQATGAGGAPAAGGAQGEEHLGGLTATELAHILWDQLEQCLDVPQPDVPAVSEPLRAIAEQVEHEMDNCALPMLANTEMGELKTFTQWALRKLHVLHSVLDLVPPPLLTPYSKTKPVPAVGTHRAAVAELLAQLLRAQCPVVAQLVAASGVLRRCAVIAVEHPNCSAIHGAVGRCLRVALSPTVGGVGLWQQLLGSAPVAAPEGALSGDRGGSLNLAAEAAAIVAAAKRDVPTIGKRPPNVGFALAVGQMLHQAATGERLGAGSGEPPAGGEAADAPSGGSNGQAAGAAQKAAAATAGDSSGAASDADAAQAAEAGSQLLAERPPEHSGLRRVRSDAAIPRVASAAVSDMPGEGESWEHNLRMALDSTEAWVDFSGGPDSLLRAALGEQVGDLGGPRPRPGCDPEPDADDADVSSGQIISGQELLMMLRGLNLGGFSGGL